MIMIITPVYSDIFEGEKPTIESLLTDIPSDSIILVLCSINAKLYSAKHSKETQIELFEFLTKNQTEEVKFKIKTNVSKRIKDNNNASLKFFSSIFCLEFIHFELLNYREFEIQDSTPQQELNFLKAYFLIAERTNSEYNKCYKQNNKIEGDFFRKNIWPTLINQTEANNNISYIPAMVRAMALFNFLEHKSPYSQYVINFLKVHNKKASWNYVLNLLNLIKTSWDNYNKEKSLFFPLSFKKVQGYETIFDQFTLNTKDYQNQYRLDKNNFTGLKEKPLFKVKELNVLLVSNWNFITNKLYDGLLFDFYKHSGINNHEKFKKYLNFKQYISYELTEKIVFRKLIASYLKKKIVSYFLMGRILVLITIAEKIKIFF